MASRLQSRWAVGTLLFVATFWVAFWIIVPDGWWAAAPRQLPSAESTRRDMNALPHEPR